MTIFSILATICRVFGWVQVADNLLKMHEAAVRAQNVADAPKTDNEWTQKAKDGEL